MRQQWTDRNARDGLAVTRTLIDALDAPHVDLTALPIASLTFAGTLPAPAR